MPLFVRKLKYSGVIGLQASNLTLNKFLKTVICIVSP